MQINLDTNVMTPDDAASLIALLITCFPRAATAMAIAMGDTVEAAKDFVASEPDAVTAFLASEPDAERAFATAPPPAPGADEEGVPFAGVVETVTASVAPPPPVGPSATDAAAPGVGDIDADGVPWDARIHSEGRAKTKDQKWRLKRGVDEATRASVTAELKAAMGARPMIAAVGAPSVAASAPASPPPPPVAVAAPPPSPEPVPVPPPVAATVASAVEPVTVAAGTASPLSGPQLFGAIMRRITEAQTGGKITAAETTELAKSVGLESVRGLLTRPDLIPAFEEVFDAMVSV